MLLDNEMHKADTIIFSQQQLSVTREIESKIAGLRDLKNLI